MVCNHSIRHVRLGLSHLRSVERIIMRLFNLTALLLTLVALPLVVKPKKALLDRKASDENTRYDTEDLLIDLE